ncbi:hypothetical protein ABZ695_30390 [Streptomyces sp. NPDC006976]|uniref:hypothetical protein n=1 Tax=unclassified Streptomyces TaxID=2593676 RepID=UPI0033DC9F38
MTFIPSTERPWRDAWPVVARADDGNAWLTGRCWLFCRREGVRVLWLGSVTTPGATGDVYACGSCVAELARMVRVQAHDRDGAGSADGACGHRQTEQRDGKTHCRGCRRQLYL